MKYIVSGAHGAGCGVCRGGMLNGRNKSPNRLNTPSSFYKVHFQKGTQIVAYMCHLAAINNIYFKGESNGKV